MLGDRKIDLVKKLNDGNVTMVTSLFNQLPPETVRALQDEASEAGNLSFGGVIIPELNINFHVRRNEIRLLFDRRDMSATIVNAFMLMLQARAHTRELAWFSRTGNKKDRKTGVSTYEPLAKHFCFSYSTSFRTIASFFQSLELINRNNLGLICIPIQYITVDSQSTSRSFWAAIILDVAQRKLYLVDVVRHCLLQQRLELREQVAPLLESLGVAGLHFEPTSYAPALFCMDRALEITRASEPDGFNPSRYESGIYMMVALYYIFSDTPIYFTENDVHNNNCIANKIIHWIKERGKIN